MYIDLWALAGIAVIGLIVWKGIDRRNLEREAAEQLPIFVNTIVAMDEQYRQARQTNVEADLCGRVFFTPLLRFQFIRRDDASFSAQVQGVARATGFGADIPLGDESATTKTVWTEKGCMRLAVKLKRGVLTAGLGFVDGNVLADNINAFIRRYAKEGR